MNVHIGKLVFTSNIEHSSFLSSFSALSLLSLTHLLFFPSLFLVEYLIYIRVSNDVKNVISCFSLLSLFPGAMKELDALLVTPKRDS